MPETDIIRHTDPAAIQRGVPRAEQALQNQVARGFIGNLQRVNASSKIIVIDDEGVSNAAPVERVTPLAALEGQSKPRIQITFGVPRGLTSAERCRCPAITWSSTNFRYLTIP